MDARDAEIARQLGGEIRRYRRKAGLSQAKLAERIDTSVEYVSMLERALRLPSVGTLVDIARALGTSVDGLLGEARDETGVSETLALVRAIPYPIRPVVMAMLRSAADAYGKGRPAISRASRPRP